MRKINLKNFGFLLMLFITVSNFLWHTYLYRQDIFKKFDAAYWTKRYEESQWVVPNSKNSIGDDGLYTYAGFRYMQGDDPTLLNAEYPPLGKYIIGFFETTTGYMGAFSLCIGAVALVIFYLFNRKIFPSAFLALIPVAIFSFDPLFTSQLRAPYLDSLYLCFLLLSFLLFLDKKYLFTGLALGAFMATKAPFLTVVVYAALLLYLFLRKSFRLSILISMAIGTLVVFTLSYTSTFLHGHDPLYLLRVQKYILYFYATGAKGVLGAVFPMILFDRWYTWYNTVQTVAEWTILWPLAFVGGLLGISMWLKKRNPLILFHSIWIILYVLFLIVIPVFARYLLLLLPFLYNLSVWTFFVGIKPKSFLA